MNLLDPISTVMSTDLITVGPEDPLKKVADIFSRRRIHHLPVVEEGKLVGMVSKSDFLFFKRGFNDEKREEKWDLFRLKSHRVKDIMTRGLAKMEPEDRINVALEVFKENLFHAIPIVTDGQLVGIVSTLDIINRLAIDKEAVNQYPKRK